MLEEAPANCTVVGVPGRIVRRENMPVPRETMDQCHLPDPILDDIHVLKRENTEFTNRLAGAGAQLPGSEKRAWREYGRIMLSI